MHEHVTLLPPETDSPTRGDLSLSLRPDLLEQVRGRIRLLALLLLVGFSIDRPQRARVETESSTPQLSPA